MSSWLLMDLLRERYPESAYALFPEVRNATGFSGDRAADAVAMCLYPSRGLEVFGFEFKASRSDWLRELKDPRKAEGVCRYCDRWWIVATKKDIVKADELPRSWGLLVVSEDGKSLRQIVQAPLLEAVPFDRVFGASMMRAAQKHAESGIKKAQRPAEEARYQALQELRAEHYETRAAEIEKARVDERKKWQEYVEAIGQFEKLSGIRLFEVITHQSWRLGKVANAVKFLIDREDAERQIGHTAAALAELSKTALAAVEELKAAPR